VIWINPLAAPELEDSEPLNQTSTKLPRSVARRMTIDPSSWWWRVPPYAIGGIASFWVVQRVAAF